MDYLTCEQVAEIVHCSIFRVREAVKDGSLKAYRPGKGYLFVRDDVDAWVRDCEALKRKGGN
jgi:excisionase family DNA binding protein